MIKYINCLKLSELFKLLPGNVHEGGECLLYYSRNAVKGLGTQFPSLYFRRLLGNWCGVPAGNPCSSFHVNLGFFRQVVAEADS